MISILPFILSTVAVFAEPESMGDTSKVVYMYLTHIFSGVICYAAYSLSAVPMQALMTGNG